MFLAEGVVVISDAVYGHSVDDLVKVYSIIWTATDLNA